MRELSTISNNTLHQIYKNTQKNLEQLKLISIIVTYTLIKRIIQKKLNNVINLKPNQFFFLIF
jgi:hypothetical protein